MKYLILLVLAGCSRGIADSSPEEVEDQRALAANPLTMNCRNVTNNYKRCENKEFICYSLSYPNGELLKHWCKEKK